jgi:polyphosphate glucokinase
VAERAFGIDIGGSGIKGAIVDTTTGTLVTKRVRIPTPQPSTPKAVAAVVATLLGGADWHGPVGATFPAVIQHGVARSAANVDKSWINTDVDRVFTDAAPSATDVYVLNDADAAGLAEARFGAAKGVRGVVIMLTFGTGIGTALFADGKLLPNTELGHMEVRGLEAEKWTSAHVRTAEKLDWPAWIERVNVYLAQMYALFWPDLFILGGAVSERFNEFAPLLQSAAEIRPAHYAGQAGVIGAALAAAGD